MICTCCAAPAPVWPALKQLLLAGMEFTCSWLLPILTSLNALPAAVWQTYTSERATPKTRSFRTALKRWMTRLYRANFNAHDACTGLETQRVADALRRCDMKEPQCP